MKEYERFESTHEKRDWRERERVCVFLFVCLDTQTPSKNAETTRKHTPHHHPGDITKVQLAGHITVRHDSCPSFLLSLSLCACVFLFAGQVQLAVSATSTIVNVPFRKDTALLGLYRISNGLLAPHPLPLPRWPSPSHVHSRTSFEGAKCLHGLFLLFIGSLFHFFCRSHCFILFFLGLVSARRLVHTPAIVLSLRFPRVSALSSEGSCKLA